jgi:DNA-binding MarR family transcriptional regulator
MHPAADPVLLIRAAFNRKALADARHRAALATRLGITETDVLAIQHLARAGELTPGQLGIQLNLSSGGTTGLIRRLEEAGHVTRTANPRDRRSAAVRLTPVMEHTATEAWAPLVAALDALCTELPEDDRETVRGFLERAADAAERQADDLIREAKAEARDALALPLPALWA